MKVLQVASECTPIIKTGGLADVVGTLPKALKNLGIDTRVALPLYEEVRSKYAHMIVEIAHGSLAFDNREHAYTVYSATLRDSGLEVFLFENDEFLSTGEIYYDKNDPDRSQKSVDRFAFFSRAVVDFIVNYATWKPEIVHCHDWHAGIVPHLFRYEYRSFIPTVFTIHNLAMQGISDLDVLNILGHDRRIPDMLIDWDAQDGNIALLLQGIIGTNIITTVSPSYAMEITTPEFGEGLDKVLRENRHKLYGILNGIDYSTWNPLSDAFITYQYGKEGDTIDDIREQKYRNKLDLLNTLNITAKDAEMLPMVGIVSRMSTQKGFQLFKEIEDEFIHNDQFILVTLGTGDKDVEELFKKWAKASPYIHYEDEFNEVLAHQIYAASDMFLIPSKFEPCGLTQMISMKYGSVPIVHGVGGLLDTVTDNENGFIFNEFTGSALWEKLELAVTTYLGNTIRWNNMMRAATQADFAWDNSARQYQLLYEKLLGKEINEVKQLGLAKKS